MNQIQKIFIKGLLMLFILIASLFPQNVELITQKINVENAIRDKVNVTINKLLEQSQYVIIVNARMDLKAFSLSDEDNKANQSGPYSAIPGLLPTIPQDIKKTTGNTYQYSNEKYLLYGLDIAVYLESAIATGEMKTNIQALIKESIPELQDCNDCIRFETMNMSGSGSSSSNYQELLKKIEKLEEDKRNAEQQILNWRFDELEKQLAISEDARTEWEDQARKREKSRQNADSIRLANLESIEKEYRKKQDSLYLMTSVKLDEAVRGRIASSDEITDKLMDIIKSGIDPSADKDLLDRPDNGMSTTVLILIIMGIIFVTTLIGLVMLTMSRKTVYLKPKEKQVPIAQNNNQMPNTTSANVNTESNVTSFDPTHANEHSDVARSDLKDLRQSTIALGVSQKDGSNQIVQDWLDTSPDGNASSDGDTITDEESE